MSVPLWQRPWFSWVMTGLFGYGAAYQFYTGLEFSHSPQSPLMGMSRAENTLLALFLDLLRQDINHLVQERAAAVH